MGRETSAHKKLGVFERVSSNNVYVHISYTSFQMQMSHGKILYKRNYLRTQAYKN